MAIVARILIGGMVGLVVGAAVGYMAKCRSGACPLTSSPLRGGILGIIIGAMFAVALSPRGETAQVRGKSDSITSVSTAAQFEQVVIGADKPVLVDFFATWCPPCKALAPIIEKLSREYSGRVVFVEVDGDQSPELAGQYVAEGYPTVIIFSGGMALPALVGLRDEAVYRRSLDDAIEKTPPTTTTTTTSSAPS